MGGFVKTFYVVWGDNVDYEVTVLRITPVQATTAQEALVIARAYKDSYEGIAVFDCPASAAMPGEWDQEIFREVFK